VGDVVLGCGIYLTADAAPAGAHPALPPAAQAVYA
jgi:hypothetical protein